MGATWPQRVLQKVHGAHPDLEIDVRLVQRKPAFARAEVAEDVDLLVVGSLGNGALPGMHLGSIANDFVHHAPCRVVVHRHAS